MTDPVATERCADERRIAAERCELATRARGHAEQALEALRLAQRNYDAHEAAAVTAAWRADPRAVHEAKEAAQGGFRAAVGAATTPELPRGRGPRVADRDQPDQHRGPRGQDDRGPRARRGSRDRSHPRTTRSRGRRRPDQRRERGCGLPGGARRGRRLRRAGHRRRRVPGDRPCPGPRRPGAAGRRRDARPGARGRRHATDLPAPARRSRGDDDRSWPRSPGTTRTVADAGSCC